MLEIPYDLQDVSLVGNKKDRVGVRNKLVPSRMTYSLVSIIAVVMQAFAPVMAMFVSSGRQRLTEIITDRGNHKQQHKKTQQHCSGLWNYVCLPSA